MPRKPRDDFRGALHHVMVRGIERRAIFMDDLDRARFLLRLESAFLNAGTACFAWALMPNHVHLFARTGHKPLAAAMHRLGTAYAMDFNRRHERVGHLFQNRYKALPVDSDGYILEVIRYIHLNPVRAGIVPDVDALDEFPWTGHRVLMGKGVARFQSVDEVLSLMGANPLEARTRLRSFMAVVLPPEQGTRKPRKSSKGEVAGGASRPAAHRREAAGAGEGPDAPPPEGSPRWVRANRLRQEGWDLPRLTRWVCEGLGVSVRDLEEGRRSRTIARARAIIAWFAWSDLALSQPVLAESLGVGATALSARMEVGRRLARELGIDPFGEVLRPPGPWRDALRELSTGK